MTPGRLQSYAVSEPASFSRRVLLNCSFLDRDRFILFVHSTAEFSDFWMRTGGVTGLGRLSRHARTK